MNVANKKSCKGPSQKQASDRLPSHAAGAPVSRRSSTPSQPAGHGAYYRRERTYQVALPAICIATLFALWAGPSGNCDAGGSTPVAIMAGSPSEAGGSADVVFENPGPRDVTIRARDGESLRGTWYTPKVSAKPTLGVVLIHDAGHDRSQMSRLGNRLARKGASVIAIDIRGHGESKTRRFDWSKLDEKGHKALWAFAQRDLEAAMDWLVSQGNVPVNRLGLVGCGASSALAVHWMKVNDNVSAIALLQPPTTAFGYNVRSDLKSVRGLPVLIIAGRGEGELETRQMVEAANATREPFIDLWVIRPPVVTSTRAQARVAKFGSPAPLVGEVQAA